MFNHNPIRVDQFIVSLLFITQFITLPFGDPFSFVGHQHMLTLIIRTKPLKTQIQPNPAVSEPILSRVKFLFQ